MLTQELSYQTLGPSGEAIFGTDAQLMAKFFTHPELSQHKSVKQGTPIYDDVICIQILEPGEPEPKIVMATDWHKHRFAKQWEMFQAGITTMEQGGTPLNLLFPQSPSTVKMLQAMHVFSIQQLAAISDSAMQNIDRGRTLVDQAKAYMQKVSGGQAFHAMSQMQAQIDEMKRQMKEAGLAVPDMPAVEIAAVPQPAPVAMKAPGAKRGPKPKASRVPGATDATPETGE